MFPNLIILVGTYAMALAAAHLVVNMTGQMPLSLGAWWAVAAYACAACLSFDLAPWIAILGGLGAGLAVGILHWLLALRLAKLSYALGTLAMQQILIAGLASLVIFGGRQGMVGVTRSNVSVLMGVSAFLLTLLLVGFALLYQTRFARCISAIRQDRLAAEGVGLSPRRNWLLLYLFAGSLMGSAGILYCFHLGSVFYTGFSVHISVLLLLAVITVRAWGPVAPVAAAVLLVLVPELIRVLPLGIGNPEFLRNIFFALLAILVMLSSHLRKRTGGLPHDA